MSPVYSCGWGSGALYFAEMLPNSQVTAFSNSRTQKEYIDAQAREKGLSNLQVITGDVAEYDFEKEKESFDRVVSIEVRRSRPAWLEEPALFFLHLRTDKN